MCDDLCTEVGIRQRKRPGQSDLRKQELVTVLQFVRSLKADIREARRVHILLEDEKYEDARAALGALLAKWE